VYLWRERRDLVGVLGHPKVGVRVGCAGRVYLGPHGLQVVRRQAVRGGGARQQRGPADAAQPLMHLLRLQFSNGLFTRLP